MEKDEIVFANPKYFHIRACKCERCGRIITSKDALILGCGKVCFEKMQAEKQKNNPILGQIDLFDGE